jgi:hypothetical protein
MCSCLGLNIKACERMHNLDQQQLKLIPHSHCVGQKCQY